MARLSSRWRPRRFIWCTGRKATADDIARIERDYVTEELLLREALENGLHRSNPSIRGSLVEEIKLNSTADRRSSPGTCAHASPQEVFAYARVSEVHWPIAFCNDCLAILEGREPFALRDAPSSGALTLESVIGRKWATPASITSVSRSPSGR